MSSLSLQSFSSCSTLSFFTLVVPPNLGIPTTDDASLKIQQLSVKNLINQPKKGKPLLPGTCTVIGCTRKESSQWYRNKEALDQTAKMCSSCYLKTWRQKNPEKVKAVYKAKGNKAKMTQEVLVNGISSLFSPERTNSFPNKVFDFGSVTFVDKRKEDSLLKGSLLEIAELHKPKEKKPLLSGTCTVVDCTTKESRQWYRNHNALEKTAKMCYSCYLKAWYKKNAEKQKAKSKARAEKAKIAQEILRNSLPSLPSPYFADSSVPPFS